MFYDSFPAATSFHWFLLAVAINISSVMIYVHLLPKAGSHDRSIALLLTSVVAVSTLNILVFELFVNGQLVVVTILGLAAAYYATFKFYGRYPNRQVLTFLLGAALTIVSPYLIFVLVCFLVHSCF